MGMIDIDERWVKIDNGTGAVTSTNPLPVTGSFSPSGPVTANQGAPNTVPNSWPVEVTDGTNILGTSTHPIRNDPTGTTTQPVSGTVAVNNFPATQPVSGTVTAVQPTGSNLHVDVDNFPATQPVSGTVAVSNFPATQPVSGTVTANQGTAAALSGAWPVEITDGTNVLGTMANPLNVNSSGSSTVSGTVNSNINGLGHFQTSQYTVGVSAVQITPTPLSNRSNISVKAITTSPSAIVYVGNSNAVTTSNGYPLFNGDSFQMDITTPQVWAISNTAGQTLAALEIGT